MKHGYIDPYYQDHPELNAVLEWLDGKNYEDSYLFGHLNILDPSPETTDVTSKNCSFQAEIKYQRLERVAITFSTPSGDRYYSYCARDSLGRFICSKRAWQLLPIKSPVDAYLELCEVLDIDPSAMNQASNASGLL